MEQEPSDAQMTAYLSAMIAALNAIEKPPWMNARSQIMVTNDFMAHFLADAIVAHEIVEAEQFTRDMLNEVYEGVLWRLRRAGRL